MDQQKQHDIALMRYSAIAPLISGLSEDYPSLEAFFRDASAKGVAHPDGSIKHYAPATIEHWYRNYKQDGFDALVPTKRADQGIPRKLDEQLQEQILYLKTNYPRMSSSAIYRQLKDNGSIKAGQLSESTVNRFVNIASIQLKTTTKQDMSCLDIREFHSLDELRGNLFAYVQIYNQTGHSSLKGSSPQDRFFSEPECIRRLSDSDIKNSFLLEIERRVSADSVIVIDQTLYEVDYRFAKQRIRLRYSPNLKHIFIVEADGTLTPIKLLNKTENANVKRDKIHLCRGHALQGEQE